MMGKAWMSPTRPHRSLRVSVEGVGRTRPHKAHRKHVQFRRFLDVGLRKAGTPRAPTPLWPFPFLLELSSLLTKIYPIHSELHHIPILLSLILLTKPSLSLSLNLTRPLNPILPTPLYY